LSPESNKVAPIWSVRIIEIIITSITSTLFEILLVGFAAFFPSYFFKIQHPLILFFQGVTASITVAYLQGCRSLAHFSYLKKDSHKFPERRWLVGVLSAIPLNLLILLYFVLYAQNPLMESVYVGYLHLLVAILIGLNFAVGVWAVQRHYKAIQQKKPSGAMGLVYLVTIFMLSGWSIIFVVLIFVFRLNISLRFPM
jgi:hypothetical protein